MALELLLVVKLNKRLVTLCRLSGNLLLRIPFIAKCGHSLPFGFTLLRNQTLQHGNRLALSIRHSYWQWRHIYLSTVSSCVARMLETQSSDSHPLKSP